MNTPLLMEAEGLVKHYASSRGIVRHARVVQAVNGVSLAVGRHDAGTKASLMNAHPRFAEEVLTLDRVIHDNRRSLVERPDGARWDEASCCGRTSGRS